MKTIVCRKDNRIVGYWHHESHKVLKQTIHIYTEEENIEKCLDDAKEFILKRGAPGHELSIESIQITNGQQDKD